jgi:hypothetical protein
LPKLEKDGVKPMRKRIVNTISPGVPEAIVEWLPLERIATVEVTSEEDSHPVENALLLGAETGWRAASPGEQSIRLIFDTPQQVRRIQLLFVDRELERLQEFVLRWSPDGGQTFREIVRQQWNFNPNSTQEAEDYRVELSGVTQLELSIVPDKSGGGVRASLAQLRLA